MTGARWSDTPDGQLVSLVGWARARERLANPICGERCIGVALDCKMSYAGILESLHDFDLVDEQGRSVPISVAGGRLLGTPNVRVFSDNEGRLLVASLDCRRARCRPATALALRDGDPLMVVGFKTSAFDPSAGGMRQEPVRASLASVPTRPLLVYALRAERNPATGGAPGAGRPPSGQMAIETPVDFVVARLRRCAARR